MRKSFIVSISVAAIVSFFYLFVVPVQSYLGNADFFNFPCRDVLLATGKNALMGLFLLTITLELLRRHFAYLIHIILIALVIYGYLEIGILASGSPTLNGDLSYYDNYYHGVWDGVIGGSVILVLLCLYRWVWPNLHWLALALMVLTGASIFDAHSQPPPDKAKGLPGEYLSRIEVIKAAFFSSHRNVMLFCLDSVTSEIADKNARDSEEIRKMYPGFIAYDNNVGMHAYTALGVPGYMTGKYLEDPRLGADYAFSRFGPDSFLREYIERDDAVFAATSVDDCALTNRAKKRDVADANHLNDVPVLQRRMGSQQDWTLEEISYFRLAPFAAKMWMSHMILLRWNFSHLGGGESVYYPLLSVAEIRDVPQAMLICHTAGCHVPFSVDRNGVDLGQPRNTFEGAYDKTHYVLKQLGALFDVFRKKGIYDNAFIVVCADHGDRFTQKPSVCTPPLPNRAFPVLWVKPVGATNDFTFSDVPTSHAKIADLFRKAVSKNLSPNEIDKILYSTSRLYRSERGGKFDDWFIDAQGGVTYKETSVTVDANSLDPIPLNKKMSVNVLGGGALKYLLFENATVTSISGPQILDSAQTMRIQFKVADKSSRYKVELGVMGTGDDVYDNKLSKGSGDYFQFSDINGESKSKKLSFVLGFREDAELTDVTPNADGLIELEGRRFGLRGDLFIPDIRVMKL